jgi:hypothetical protein
MVLILYGLFGFCVAFVEIERFFELTALLSRGHKEESGSYAKIAEHQQVNAWVWTMYVAAD